MALFEKYKAAWGNIEEMTMQSIDATITEID